MLIDRTAKQWNDCQDKVMAARANAAAVTARAYSCKTFMHQASNIT